MSARMKSVRSLSGHFLSPRRPLSALVAYHSSLTTALRHKGTIGSSKISSNNAFQAALPFSLSSVPTKCVIFPKRHNQSFSTNRAVVLRSVNKDDDETYDKFEPKQKLADKNDDVLNENSLLLENKKNYLTLQYEDMVRCREISHDDLQMGVLQELDRLRRDILLQPSSSRSAVSPESINDNKNNNDGFFGLSNIFRNVVSSLNKNGIEIPTTTTKGVYIHGGVGCGKTFCMDQFYHSIPPSVISKQKVHFHKFMLDVHAMMHQAKMGQKKKVVGDVLPTVIRTTLTNGRLICFDEFQVTDVADALILRRLFTGLLKEGAVIVATSNRPPQDLYLNGLQRDLFLPFIELLKKEHTVVDMWESETDYRTQKGEQGSARDVYFVGEQSRLAFNQAFHRLTKDKTIHNNNATVTTSQGRRVDIPCSVDSNDGHDRIAKLSFDYLCRTPMGAADYIAIGENFGTVLLESVPKLSMDEVNLVRRFIVLIDSLYECKVRLIVQAEATPENLFQVDLEDSNYDEAFAFDRTRSRLEEMGSEAYLKERGHYE